MTSNKVRVTPDGAMRCPFCGNAGFYEWDRSERWNDIEYTVQKDGTITASVHQRDGDYETVGYLCTACEAEVAMPDEFKIVEWL